MLPFDRAAAASVRSALEKAGRPIAPLDTLIAGTALAPGHPGYAQYARVQAGVEVGVD